MDEIARPRLLDLDRLKLIGCSRLLSRASSDDARSFRHSAFGAASRALSRKLSLKFEDWRFYRSTNRLKSRENATGKTSLNDRQKVGVREGRARGTRDENISILHDTAGKARMAGANKSVQAGRKPGYEEDEGEPTVGVFINGSVKRDHPSGAISFHQSLISLLRVVQHLVTPGGTLTAPQEVLMKTNLTQNGGHTYFLLRLSLSLPALFFSPYLSLLVRVVSPAIDSTLAIFSLPLSKLERSLTD